MKLILAAVAAALILIPVAGATGGGEGGGHTPVTVCHKPGTPAEHTLTFDDDALFAHLAHGDTLGACAPAPPAPVCPEGTTEYSTNPLVCLKTVTVEVIKEVPVPGPTVTVIQYVDKVVTVTKDVPGPTVTVTKVVYKTKLVNKVKVKVKVVYRTKIVVKRETVYKYCPVQGKG